MQSNTIGLTHELPPLFPQPLDGFCDGPARHNESHYAWLCRQNHDRATTAKLEFESLFRKLPSGFQIELATKLKATDTRTHLGAVFECVVWHWLRACGSEPEWVQRQPGQATPDFRLVGANGGPCFVEATVVHPDQIRESQEAQLRQLLEHAERLLNGIPATIEIESWKPGSRAPSAQRFAAVVRAAIKHDDTGGNPDAIDDLEEPCYRFHDESGWEILFTLRTGNDACPGLAIGSISGGVRDDDTMDRVRGALGKKRRHLVPLQDNLVIAFAGGSELMLMRGDFVLHALLGSPRAHYASGQGWRPELSRAPDGLWYSATTNTRRRSSPVAVIYTSYVPVYYATMAEPILIVNPYIASEVVLPDWPFRKIIPDHSQGRMIPNDGQARCLADLTVD